MAYILKKISKNTTCVVKHVYKNKHWYALGTFGMFAVVKMVILFAGFFGLSKATDTFAAENQLNSTNIATTYGCDIKSNYCDLSKKGITSIATKAFINYPNLESIILDDNQISTIADDAFYGPTKLIVLHLNDNLLTSLPGGVINVIKNLKDFSINRNCWDATIMSKESTDVLENMTAGNWKKEANKACPVIEKELNSSNITTTYGCDTKAEFCDFNKKGITSIATNTFINHPNIISIEFNDNKIYSIAENAFNGATKLQNIRLNGNLLTALPESVITTIKNAKEVSVDRNCWNRTSMTKEFIEVLDKIGGGSWQKELNAACPFSCANVKDIPQAECESLVKLYETTNGGQWTNSSGRFSSLRAANRYGIAVENGHILAVTLGSNNLSGTIPTEINRLTSMRKLDLSSNQITSIATDAFVGLTDLGDLNISNNKLTTLVDGVFTLLPHLAKVNITNNLLSIFPVATTENYQRFLKKVNYLEINIGTNCWNSSNMSKEFIAIFDKKNGNNYWRTELNAACPFSCAIVKDVTQAECDSLVKLYETTNGAGWANKAGRLSSPDVANRYGITAENGRVRTVNLGSNNLSGTIPTEINKLTSIRQLDLNSNQITSIATDAFVGLTDLNNINMSNNKITALEDGVFSYFANLFRLNISNNLLTIFPATTAESIQRFKQTTEKIEELSIGTNCWNTSNMDKELIAIFDKKVGNDSWRTAPNKVCPFSCENVTDVPQSECESLVKLYETTNGSGWKNKDRRLSSNQVGKWNGIEVREMGEDKKQHVISINLADNNLVGDVSFSGLTYVQNIVLPKNKITGITLSGVDLSNLRDLDIRSNLLTTVITTTPEMLKKRSNVIERIGGLSVDYNCWNPGSMSKEIVEMINKKSGGDRWQKEFNPSCPSSCEGSPVEYSCSDISPDSLASAEKYCPLFYSRKDNAQCAFDAEKKGCKAVKMCESIDKGLYISYDTNISAKITVATVNFPNEDCAVVNGDDVYKFNKNGTYFFEVKCPVIDPEKTIRLLANVSWLKDVSGILVPNASRLKSADLIYKSDGNQITATAQFANGKETKDYTDTDRKKAAYATSIKTVNILPGKTDDMIEQNEKVYLKNTSLDMAASAKITKETILTDNKTSIVIPASSIIFTKDTSNGGQNDTKKEYSGTFIVPVKIESTNEISDNLKKALGGNVGIESIYKFGSDNADETLYVKKDTSDETISVKEEVVVDQKQSVKKEYVADEKLLVTKTMSDEKSDSNEENPTEEYNTFTITMETAEVAGKKLNVYFSQDGVNWEFFTGATVAANDENGSYGVSFAVDHLTYYALTASTGTVTSQNITSSNGGGSSITKDTCPVQRDCSDSYYDSLCGSCSLVEKIIQKLPFHYDNVQSGSIVNSSFSSELNSAYLWAYGFNITTIPTIQNANIGGTLIRKDMAKMISNFALNVLDKDVSTGQSCTFSDMSGFTKETQYYAMVACRLGLMGYETDGITLKKNFDPEMEVDRAQFGTILSRLLRKGKNNGGIVYYQKHLASLKKEGIMTKIETPSAKEKRGRVMIMLQRVFQSK